MGRRHLASGGDGIRSGLRLSLCQGPAADPQDSLPAAVCLERFNRTTPVPICPLVQKLAKEIEEAETPGLYRQGQRP